MSEVLMHLIVPKARDNSRKGPWRRSTLARAHGQPWRRTVEGIRHLVDFIFASIYDSELRDMNDRIEKKLRSSACPPSK